MNYNTFENKVNNLTNEKVLSFEDVMEVIAPILEDGKMLTSMLTMMSEIGEDVSKELSITENTMNTAYGIGFELFNKVAEGHSLDELGEMANFIKAQGLC